MTRVIGSLLVIALVVMTLEYLSCAGDPKPLVIAASPACGELPNPCSTMKCEPKRDTREMT